jgi:ABC-type uncharacterized transport system permease subunit
MILASASSSHLVLVLATALTYAISSMGALRLGQRLAQGVFWLAWLLHALVLYQGLLGAVPHFGFAPVMSVTAWLVAAVYAIEVQIYPSLQARWPLAALSALAVLLALVFPGSPLHASASPWLALHWALGVASYGLFGAAVVHAWWMSRASARMRSGVGNAEGLPLLTMERLTFRLVGTGFVLLTATLLVGLLFGNTLYGVAAGLMWSHKTVFSVLSWLTFAVLLVGRARWGWRGRHAVHILYAGVGLLLLAYVGSRFVLEVVLGRTV